MASQINDLNDLSKIERYFSDEYISMQRYKRVSSDKISDVLAINIDNNNLFLKRYFRPSKSTFSRIAYALKIGKSKARRERDNLNYFNQIGLDVPNIYYFGEDREKGYSCLVTESVNKEPFCKNLKEYLDSTNNNDFIINKFILILAKLHKENFIHFDFRTRNILFFKDRLYLIDCPNGAKFNFLASKIFGYWLKYFKRRDLASVYKDLKNILSPKQLLKLYKTYLSAVNNFDNIYFKLSSRQKAYLIKIINHFS